MGTETNREIEPECTWQIDRARPGDGRGIEQVRKEAWIATYPDPGVGLTLEDIMTVQFDSPEKLAKWDTKIEGQGNDNRIWVVRENETIIGFAVAQKTEAKHELNAIYISPSHHRKGIGQALMHAVLEWLGDDRDIVVWVFSHNAGAISFYRKNLFQETGKTSLLPINGKDIPDLEMIRTGK